VNRYRWRAILGGFIPKPVKSFVSRSIGLFSPASAVIEEWELYARDQEARAREGSAYPGEEWNSPTAIGVDVSAEEVVSHIDESIITPFVGKTGVLLEIGSGGGRFTEILIPKTDRLIAADTSPTMIRILKRRFADRTNVEYLLLNGSDLHPLEDGSVDVVVAYDVFVHLTQWEIFSYLTEVRRVLTRPSGKALIHHGNTFSDLVWRKFLWDANRRAQGLKPLGAFTLMTPAVMRELASRAGLEVLDSLTTIVRRDCITLLALKDRPEQSS
jgi:2-polyprenyl-3-methyl-5-hydroxy-6-metoxy-1,4-benzoquinol methylase